VLWGYDEVDGWFFSNKWNYYQKRKGMASSYIEAMFGFYRVHVTYSGGLGMCDIEYRDKSPQKAFKMAESLLDKYKDKEKHEFWNDYWSPHNPNGYWQKEYRNE
jgi:hypothetical protein